jgi:hypothetical protein
MHKRPTCFILSCGLDGKLCPDCAGYEPAGEIPQIQLTCPICNLSILQGTEEIADHFAACDRREFKDWQKCPHAQHFILCEVANIVDKGGFYADIHIFCLGCGVPFHFVGVDGGLSPRANQARPVALPT